MRRTRLLTVALGVATALAGVALVESPAVSLPDRLCSATSPIPAHALAKGVDAGCDLAGRVVTTGVVAAQVPPAGGTVFAEGYVGAGAEELPVLQVSNLDGVVTARESHAEGAGPTAATTGARIGPGCDTTTSNPWAPKWKSTYAWYHQAGSTPTRFNATAVEYQLKAAANNVGTGRNDCGLVGDPKLAQLFKGRTGDAPQINVVNGQALCGGAPNFSSVIGWKTLPSPLLGVACWWTWSDDPNRIRAADIALDSDNPYLVVKLPASCSNKVEIQDVATHEIGHAVGFNHVSNTTYTMNPTAAWCDTHARTFARGEWIGLKNKYGLS